MKWVPEFDALQNALIQVYDHEPTIRRIARQAQIEIAHINWNGTPSAQWHSVLEEAVKTKKLSGLVQILSDEYPAQAEILPGLNWWENINLSQENLAQMLDPNIKLIRLPEISLNTFVGRQKELSALENAYRHFQQENRPYYVLLTGPSGTGKTRIAEFFACNKSGNLQGKAIKVELNGGQIGTIVENLAQYCNFNHEEEIQKQSITILRQIPEDSILIIDNVNNFKNNDVLKQLGGKVFVIITSQSDEIDAFFNVFEKGTAAISIREMTPEDCVIFFENRLRPEILAGFAERGFKLKDALGLSEQRRPLFLAQICRVLNKAYETGDNDSAILYQKIENMRNQSLVDACGSTIQRAMQKNDNARQVLMAAACFSPALIPLQQLGLVSNLETYDEVARELHAQDIFSRTFEDENQPCIKIHDEYHRILIRLFAELPNDRQNLLRANYVRVWLDFLFEKQQPQDLWRMRENIVNMMKWMPSIPGLETILKNSRQITREKILLLQRIAPPRYRRELLWRLLSSKKEQEDIAYLMAGLAECFLRDGNFNLAESFALQSLHLFEKLNIMDAQADVLKRLGTIYRSDGRYGLALEKSQAAWEIYSTLNYYLHADSVKRHIAETYVEIGQVNLGYKMLQEVRNDIEADIGPQPSEAYTGLAYLLTTLGNAQLKLGLFQEAKQTILDAIKYHVQVVGNEHYYVAYDLRYLAKAEMELGEIKNAVGHLEQASLISKRFFGESPALALLHLSMAEALLLGQNTIEARKYVQSALEIYNTEIRSVNKYRALAYRILAQIDIAENNLPGAEEHLLASEKILLDMKLQDTPHFSELTIIRAKLEFAAAQLDAHKYVVSDIEKRLWAARTKFIQFEWLARFSETTSLIQDAILKRDIDNWDKSVRSYRQYLRDFPESLHNQLGAQMIEEIRVAIKRIPTAKILDVFCGAGYITEHLYNHIDLKEIEVTGVDGAPAMISAALNQKRKHSWTNADFLTVPEQAKQLSTQQFDILTAHMGIFQVDLRSRHFLFQRVLPLLKRESQLIFSTYAADFVFPPEIEMQYPEINGDNQFKIELFERFRKAGIKQENLQASLSPVFTKENYHTLSNFFEFYGFKLVPESPRELAVLPVKRTWQDRISFTRIPAISEKVFGRSLSADEWNKLDAPPDYEDTTYGTVFCAIRQAHLDCIPKIFSHVDVDFSQNIPVRYAVAAALKRRDGKVLFVRRGDGARDFNGAWSLCSTFADPGKGLIGSFFESLNRHLGIDGPKITALNPISIRFSPRTDSDGNAWIMAMCLYQGNYDFDVTLKSNKYAEISWRDPAKFFHDQLQNKNPIGDCIKSYRDWEHLQYVR